MNSTVEIRLTRPTVCTTCGHSYFAPVVHRTGVEAVEFFKGKAGVDLPPDLVELDHAVQQAIDDGNLIPVAVDEPDASDLVELPLGEECRSYSFSQSICKKCNCANVNDCVGFAFACESCGKDSHFAVTDDRPVQVTCKECQKTHDADWTLVGS